MQPADSNATALAVDLSNRVKATVNGAGDDVLAALGAAAFASMVIELGLMASEKDVEEVVPKIMPFMKDWARDFRAYANDPEYGAVAKAADARE
jgi:hypothetical protein